MSYKINFRFWTRNTLWLDETANHHGQFPVSDGLGTTNFLSVRCHGWPHSGRVLIGWDLCTLTCMGRSTSGFGRPGDDQLSVRNVSWSGRTTAALLLAEAQNRLDVPRTTRERWPVKAVPGATAERMATGRLRLARGCYRTPQGRLRSSNGRPPCPWTFTGRWPHYGRSIVTPKGRPLSTGWPQSAQDRSDTDWTGCITAVATAYGRRSIHVIWPPTDMWVLECSTCFEIGQVSSVSLTRPWRVGVFFLSWRLFLLRDLSCWPLGNVAVI